MLGMHVIGGGWAGEGGWVGGRVGSRRRVCMYDTVCMYVCISMYVCMYVDVCMVCMVCILMYATHWPHVLYHGGVTGSAICLSVNADLVMYAMYVFVCSVCTFNNQL